MNIPCHFNVIQKKLGSTCGHREQVFCVCLLQPSVKSQSLVLPSSWPWVVREWVEYIKSSIASVNENTNEPPTDGQTDRASARTHTTRIHTPVSNEALMQNAITSNCLSGEKKKKKLSGRDVSKLYCSYTRGGWGYVLNSNVCLPLDCLRWMWP